MGLDVFGRGDGNDDAERVNSSDADISRLAAMVF
jgi:hypothetical protein